MWFLEHETLFGGKRMWLKPGTQQILGRTPSTEGPEGKTVTIDSRNVSRKHIVLKVFGVPPEDGTKLHSRSQVEITDFSKFGTTIDDKTTLKEKTELFQTVLTGTEHKIQLGRNYPPFRLKWQPVVFTYAVKENKENRTRSAKLHALDIKTSTEYIYNKTTHVVSQKRNLPKVLQGLVGGTFIVTSAYLDAVIEAAAPQNADQNNYIHSKLEEDFDTWWPKEKEYIPPAGAEPVPRPEQMLEPDSTRSEVFSGLTFVFLDENQYNSLHEPISGGGGKALFFHVRHGETTVDEYVEFVRNTAGEKRRGRTNNNRLPVITIRLSNYPAGMEEWATNFVNGVDRALNQRSILQNEFLDAIITNDASSLQKPPPEVEIVSSMPEPSRAESSIHDVTQTSQPGAPFQAPGPAPGPTEEPAKIVPRKRPARRGLTTSRFTGFDDYEPPTKSRKLDGTPMEDVQASESVPDSFQESQPATQTGRKRPSPVEVSVEPSTQIDELFPAAAAIKRRRLEARGASTSVEPETQPARKPKTKGAEVLEQLQKAKKRAAKEIDVREQARLRIQEEEDKRKADEESLRQALEGVDISEIRGLVQIEEMYVRPRGNRANQRQENRDERWNDEWNGRKNFKKFRRRGAERGPQAQKVIVTLEEAPQKKSFGLGEEFFLEETSKTRSKEDERRLKRRMGKSRRDDDSEPEPGFMRRKKRNSAQQEVINVDDSNPDDEDVLPEGTPRSRSFQERVEETQADETRTQRGTRKRTAMSVAAGRPSSKRSRAGRRADDSDDEETGFRFRSRR
ncbi:hypothetical protein K469DRAFT_553755 [Zopfia rhizophila CBS 207.26]|uniref:FHA domain-containing protein n=1 Tax=Zopfia rhizophila CBS 207.26 TaxID=1314779 RepID=A0A6A6ELU6_9PEZI|nr:hypothetical protein K469DRAFT_553755 [Zopfia rhizophila CBS 207.26]